MGKAALSPAPSSPFLRDSSARTRLTDRELVDRFRSRNAPSTASVAVVAEAAFVELVRRHGPRVLNVCRTILKNPQDAEDAFQATFLVLARKASSIQNPDRLPYWLVGVATRVAKKAKAQQIRRTRREVPLSTTPEVERVRHMHTWGFREEVETVHEEIARLPEKYRLPVVLCDLEGFTHVEASRRLGWPSGSLSVRLMRARELLRGRLMRRGIAPTSAMLAITAWGELNSTAFPASLVESTAKGILRGLPGHGPLSSASGAAFTSASSRSRCGLSVLGQTRLARRLTALNFGWIGVVAVVFSLTFGNRDPFPTSRPGLLQRADSRLANSIRDRPGPRAGAIVEREGGGHMRNDGVQGGVGPLGLNKGEIPKRPEPHDAMPGEALANYQVLVKQVERNALSQVHLALWCEANGLAAERLRHLLIAVLTDPDQATARGLLGQVSVEGRWRNLEELGARMAEDTRFTTALAAYRGRRAGMRDTAEEHWKLALWCERNRLDHEAKAHLTAVTRMEPARDAAWRRLGYLKSRGRWMRPEQVAFEAKMVAARRAAEQTWRPRLTKWKSELKDETKRRHAEAELAQITDPFAAIPIWTTFAQDGVDNQKIAAQLLGRIEGRDASLGLAFLAVRGDSPETRRIATEVLTRRDTREVVGLLISLLIDPVKYQARAVQGPGTPGMLFVEGERLNHRRFYTVPSLPSDTIRRLLDPTTPPDYTLPTAAVLGEDWARFASLPISGQVFRNNVKDVRQNLAVAARATLTAQQQLDADTRVIEAHNLTIQEQNQRIEPCLRALTEKDFGPDRESWLAWWTDAQGYAYTPPYPTEKPTIDQEIPLPYVPRFQRITGMSCFGVGTPVCTREGQRTIEEIRVGDVVLTQHLETGALGFAPVLAVFHNKPAPTLKLSLDSNQEPIVVTGIHRFWATGKGWVMGRDLKAGDRIRILGGQAEVRAITQSSIEDVFNLEVGENQNFFAGISRALVHDNSLVKSVPQPFDQLTLPPR